MKTTHLKTHWGAIVIFFAITIACAVGLSQTVAAAETPQYGGTLKIIARLSTSVLGTPKEGRWGFSRYARPCYDSIFVPGPKFEPQPGLVKSFDVSPDGKTILFHVREGAKFHDGTDVNAEAIHWALTHMGGSSNYTRRIDSYDVVDDHTLRLNMKEFDANLFTHTQYAAGFVCSPTAYKLKATPEERAKKHMVGAGPFKYSSWERDVNIIYKKNENYWDKGKPYLDELQFIWIKDPVTAVAAFRAGEGQMIIDLLPKQGYDLKKDGYKVETVALGGHILVPDGANPDSPFADKRVRQAVEYAIDRKMIAEGLGYGFWEAANQPDVKGGLAYDPDFKGREYNPAKAKKLLADAGYPKGFQTRLIARTVESQDALVSLQTFLGEVGIKAKIEIVDRGKYAEINQKGWKNALVWGTAYGARMDNYDRTHSVHSTRNKSMYRPAGWQEKIDAGIAEPNFEKRVKIIKELARTTFDEAMSIPLWTQVEIWAMTDKVHIEYGEFHPYHFVPATAWLSK